jgi:hypothetical protein
MQAHGAWVYLFASVASGAFVGSKSGVEPAMLVGTAFAGAYLGAAAFSVGLDRRASQLGIGALTAALATLGALWIGAEPRFLVVASGAAATAVGSVLLARRFGFLSRRALVCGIATLALAAPATAVGGGAEPLRAWALFGLLWPFFCWRTLRIAASLGAGLPWDRDRMRRRGLREAAVAALWAMGSAVALRFL